ncbi:glycosyltransferase [bacterium]|nr:glycosyltransferase [bacterium]
MNKIVVDPSIRIIYSSFYIRGLEDLYGKRNVCFSAKYFSDLCREVGPDSYDQYMPFVLLNGSDINRFIIDFRDKPSIDCRAYEWCDVYAKINYNKNITPDFYKDKIISITPSFGIKIWNFRETIYFLISNLFKCKFALLVPLDQYIKDYLFQYFKCLRVEEYYNIPSSKSNSYVFFISTLWGHENCVNGTNFFRKQFIEVCSKNKSIMFEGGLYSNSLHSQYVDFKDFIYSKKYSRVTYVQNSILSLFVFNVPSVHDCHGWKLGEFLAMGKAIISMPLSNSLPCDLIHGENIHLVSNIEEIDEAVLLLLNDKKYRMRLADGARRYYMKYASPKSVIESIVDSVPNP